MKQARNFCRARFSILVLSLLLVMISQVSLAAESDSAAVSTPNPLAGTSIGGLYFLSYQHGETDGVDYSEFVLRRAYLTVKKSILPNLNARITIDATQDTEGGGRGDMEVRIKYTFAEFELPDLHFLNHQTIEFGIVHAPWLAFEEAINPYRMREKMFIERSDIVNSADFGVTYAVWLGDELSDDYRKRVNRRYAGEYGSISVGFYNGGGYHAIEENRNKVFEARLTIRPLGRTLPGLQLSGFGVVGKGNATGGDDQTPDWNVQLGMLSYEHEYFTFAAQYIHGTGNQDGDWYRESSLIKAQSYSGAAAFGEIKFGKHWRTIGGYDYFKPDEDGTVNEFIRYFAGIGYEIGKGNILLFDYDRTEYKAASLPDDHRYQMTMQVRY